MSKVETSGEGRPSDNQAPAPSQSSPEEHNRSEEAARLQQQQQQQQHQSFASMGGGQNHPRSGGSMGMPPYQQMHPQQQMMMPPDLRYLQEMRRAEELMMASQGGGGPRGMNDFAVMNAARFPPGGQHQWPDAQRGGGGPPRMGNMPPSQQDRSSSSSGGDPSVARMPPQEHNPAVLLSLLQQEQERLMNLQRQQGNMPESWLPPAKRPRLPTHNVNSGNAEHQWMAQNSMARMPQGFLDASSAESTKPAKERKRHVKSFPVKLMEAINDHYDEGVLAWLPDGKSFVVVDPEGFVDNVLLDAFKGGKYSSFVRKLNRWGFSRLISGTGMDCFHNPLFQRDRPELCSLITSGDRDDTQGVNPLLLGHKPSLTGIEKYFALREERGKPKDGSHTVSDPPSDAGGETKEEEAKAEGSSSKPRAKKGNGESLKGEEAVGV